MNELDQVWSQMLDDAEKRARESGRHDVADYLSLKARNDAMRQASVGWIFDTLIEIAGEANRNRAAITIEREDPHNFADRGANMAGSLLRLRQGVRCLTVEAGWTRTPADGFMRGGALAFARITHFGMPKHSAELQLILAAGSPEWKTTDPVAPVDSAVLREHIEVLLGDI